MIKKINYLLFFVFVLITGITNIYSMEQERKDRINEMLNKLLPVKLVPGELEEMLNEHLPVELGKIIIDYKNSIEKEEKSRCIFSITCPACPPFPKDNLIANFKRHLIHRHYSESECKPIVSNNQKKLPKKITDAELKKVIAKHKLYDTIRQNDPRLDSLHPLMKFLIPYDPNGGADLPLPPK